MPSLWALLLGVLTGRAAVALRTARVNTPLGALQGRIEVANSLTSPARQWQRVLAAKGIS